MILVNNQIVTLGNLLTFNILFTYFMLSLRNIIELDRVIDDALLAFNKLNNLLKQEKLKSLNIKQGKIEIKNLNFSYNGRDKNLKNINLKIKPGEKIMINGCSGSGKSTLCKLIMQYYKPNKKTIYIDDIDINKYSINNITFIAQEENLFTDTIYNNLVLDSDIDEITLNKVVKLCELKPLLDMNSYNTFLEENGSNLSGGQKQQLILARSLLKKPEILIIDEGLNQMDINLERKILKNIFKAYPNKTILIVNHRNDNLDLFDKLITLKNGKINIKERVIV